MKKNKKKNWNDYIWIMSAVYMILGFVNIMFAWLGLICFLVPLGISLVKGKKSYCNHFCGRGQMFDVLGNKLKLSRQKDIPAFLRSNWFRYGFLTFFMIMFANMVFMTYLVFAGSGSLKEVVTLIWTIKMPWDWAYNGAASSPWIAQFAFGFYGMMLTSTVLGLVTMALYKPRSWCVYCPMGTMTQGICKIKDAA
ncbi:4Fe-4S binding protein [Anaerobium acetethylicum]|uniref:4Fe-4S binding domain-containing protein n=1 Tax=Anaerobium acetethylicum TaxID=1619234 RepID=A0A1D3TN86_9FIRM|nr:4Fe-4S binding protein [Anaerobium acetethylicum]SCP94769.1 4Fe-4S binding domain-containing protein [Anaerobium acetethylicum]